MNTSMYLVTGVSEEGASHLETLCFPFLILFIVQGVKNTKEEHSIPGTESVSVPGTKLWSYLLSCVEISLEKIGRQTEEIFCVTDCNVECLATLICEK